MERQTGSLAGAALGCCLALAATAAAAQTAAGGKVAPPVRLVMGITPSKATDALESMYAPLVGHLTQVLRREIAFRVTKDYNELSDRIRDEAVDIGLFSPRAWVKAKRRQPDLVYLATAKTRDEAGNVRDHYKGVILVLKSSHYFSLKDSRNSRLGLTDTDSTSGYLYPVALLAKNGLPLEGSFNAVFLLKKHDKVVDALVAQSIDVGATSDNNLVRAVKKHGDVFRILAETDPIPFDAYAAGPHVSPADRDAVKQALLALPEDSAVFAEMEKRGIQRSGFVDRGDAFYDIVRLVEGGQN